VPTIIRHQRDASESAKKEGKRLALLEDKKGRGRYPRKPPGRRGKAEEELQKHEIVGQERSLGRTRKRDSFAN